MSSHRALVFELISTSAAANSFTKSESPVSLLADYSFVSSDCSPTSLWLSSSAAFGSGSTWHGADRVIYAVLEPQASRALMCAVTVRGRNEHRIRLTIHRLSASFKYMNLL